VRYFTRPRPQVTRSDDDGYYPVGNSWSVPTVSDHEATDTGLLDVNGDPIMRAPNPIGFGRDDEW